MARYEWIIIELAVLGVLFWEWRRIKRSIAKDKAAGGADAGPRKRPGGSAP